MPRGQRLDDAQILEKPFLAPHRLDVDIGGRREFGVRDEPGGVLGNRTQQPAQPGRIADLTQLGYVAQHELLDVAPQPGATPLVVQPDNRWVATADGQLNVTSQVRWLRREGELGGLACEEPHDELAAGLCRYDATVNAAFEVSPDDPQGLAEAIQRAAQGAVVHLVRDGQAVADIVPAASAQANKADCNEKALAIERRHAERFGAPTLVDYRRVYETSGWPWPGDDAIRRDYLVADAC